MQQLYPSPLPQLSDLAQPFSHDEIYQAFLSMNTNASPGPDGFGPIFYRKYWNDIKQPILTFFSTFHDQTASLERFNRAFMVLLPKFQAPTTPDAFRPISLQNCTPKVVAKVLTNRVKLSSHCSYIMTRLASFMDVILLKILYTLPISSVHASPVKPRP